MKDGGFIGGEKDLSFLSKELILNPFTKEKKKNIYTSKIVYFANNFLSHSSQKKGPGGIKENIEFISEEIIGGDLEIFGKISDSMINRIRYEFGKDFVEYLLKKFGMSNDVISEETKSDIARAKEKIYNETYKCDILPEVFLPVIEDILERVNGLSS